MATVNDEYQAHLLIESNLNHFATQGISRKHGDLEAYLRYRQSLAPTDRQLFDELLREGNYAGSAAELLDIYAGRQEAHTQQNPTVVKAS